MNKTNLFTLFLTVIVVVIAAEYFVNDYGDVATQGGANVVGANSESTQQPTSSDWSSAFAALHESQQPVADGQVDPQSITFDTTAFDLGTPDTVPAESGLDIKQTQSGETVEADINFGLIGLAGFQNVTLQRVPFNGILFEKVDLRDFNTVPVVQQNLLQNNKDRIAGFYEFHGDSEAMAGEIYLYIKEKASAGLDVNINETNEFGNNSFYINYASRPDAAFLVVKIRESVYALTYEKGLHPFIESLLTYLNT